MELDGMEKRPTPDGGVESRTDCLLSSFPSLPSPSSLSLPEQHEAFTSQGLKGILCALQGRDSTVGSFREVGSETMRGFE